MAGKRFAETLKRSAITPAQRCQAEVIRRRDNRFGLTVGFQNPTCGFVPKRFIENPKRRRFNAVLAFRGLNDLQFARLVGCSNVHLRAVVLGERIPSARLAKAIRTQLGEHWAFVMGKSTCLRDSR
jgi:hypothetical protein